MEWNCDVVGERRPDCYSLMVSLYVSLSLVGNLNFFYVHIMKCWPCFGFKQLENSLLLPVCVARVVFNSEDGAAQSGMNLELVFLVFSESAS